MGFELSLGTRVRRSAYFEATVAAGVTAFSVYNHMMMPTSYGDPEAEYWRLKNDCAIWDVAVERQVELYGPDAGELARILSPRRIDKLKIGRGLYVAVCDHNGVLLNDPVLLKLAEDRYWLSIASSDLLLWARAVANERGLDVRVSEPDVSPLAVQGPKAEDVVAHLFGEWVRELKLFWFIETELDGIPVVLARSGWSKQGGFEIYLRDSAEGVRLWNMVTEAGLPYGIGPGSPNPAERIESGLLSYGADTDSRTNPFEVGMARYVHTDLPDDVIGMAALRKIEAEGPARRLLGLIVDHPDPFSRYHSWFDIQSNGKKIGSATATAMSIQRNQVIGMALVDISAQPAMNVVVKGPEGPRDAVLTDFPFT